jgi:ketosteroid isomerase-like protein
MKYAVIVALCLIAGFLATARAQQKNERITITPALEKELFAVEQQWMKGEFDKNMDLLTDLWTDDFFDVLSSGRVVTKHEMMDQLSKADRKPGTGAFPEDFKLRAVYGNVALATDHTLIKGVDANGNLVVTREMNVLRMFVKENGKWRVAGAGLVPLPAK